MSGICGWIGSEFSGDSSNDVLSCLVGGLPPGSQAGVSSNTDITGLYASNGTDESTTFSSNGVHVAIVGTPRWTASHLISVTQAHGLGTALVEAYKRYGLDLLTYLRGSFALALIDSTNHKSIIATDRMGTEPICYAITNKGGLIFGSTVEAVRRHPALSVSLNLQAIYEFAYFHIIPSPETIYREIHKLQPAQHLLFSNATVKIARYWQPTFHEDASESFACLRDELQQNLQKTISRYKCNDETGAFLSGGTDSSTVCGILAGLSDRPVQTYAIGFDADGYDEIRYARTAARHFGVKLNEYYVTPQDVAEAIPEVAQAYDEPFGNSSAIPTLLCARLAKDNGTRVLLAGDGGDELFAGNARYAKQKIFHWYTTIPKWLRHRVLEPLLVDHSACERIPALRKIRSYIDQARLPMPNRMESYNFLRLNALSSVFDPEFLRQIDVEHAHDMLDTAYWQAPAKSLLNRMLYLDWKLTLADNDLRKVTRMCNLAGVEVRYPFLDDDIVEFAARVPPVLKLKGLKLRYFYKRALKDFLPSEVIKKSKHGFGLPFGEWLKTAPALQELIYPTLYQLKSRKIFRADFIERLVETHRRDHAAYYGTMVWVLVMLEQWLQQHQVDT